MTQARIVIDDPVRFGDWAKTRIPYVTNWGDGHRVIGLERDGNIQAACIYNCYSGADIAIHIAAVPGRRWLTRSYICACFAYPFLQLGVRRLTGYVPSKNTDALRLDLHLGFTQEGVMRHALWDDDIIVLGMLKEECRFIRES